MQEFGEQLKRAREEKGYTQQALAEKLYVTRQTISRWESGSRYPDLQMAKKLSQVLSVSVDELLSGETIESNIEKAPVLEETAQITVQTVVYAMAFLAYLLMSYFSWTTILLPNEGLAGTPAGRIDALTVFKLAEYTILALLLLYGIIQSARKKCTPLRIALIVGAPYACKSAEVLLTYIVMTIRRNGYMPLYEVLAELVIPAACFGLILVFFLQKSDRISCMWIWGPCVISLMYVVYGYLMKLRTTTDLGFVVKTVHLCGMASMIVLLAYQAYIHERRKRKAVRLDIA